MKTTLRLLNHPRLPSIRTVGFCSQRFPAYINTRRDFHQHDVVELFLVLSGEGTHLTDQHEWPLAPGDTGIVHFGQSHCIMSGDGPMDIVNLYIDPSRTGLPPLAPPLNAVLPRILPLAPGLGHQLNAVQQYRLAHPDRMAGLLLAMADEAAGAAAGYMEAMRFYLRLVLLEYARFAHEHLAVDPDDVSGPEFAVERVRRHLDDHWAEPVDLDVLMRCSRLSKAHLCRVFKKYTGRTIVEYVHQRRVEQAMMLLSGTQERIATVAKASGFGDLAQFNRIFRRLTGATPTAFRARR